MNGWTLATFIDMGGYGLYVWGSLAMCAAVVAAECLVLRMRRQVMRQQLQDQRALAQEFEEVVR